MKCDAKTNARQNDIHPASNFHNSTFEYPDHEKF